MINLIDMILIIDDVIGDDECELLISEFEKNKPIKESSREINSSKIQETDANFLVLNPKTKTHQIANDKTNIMVGHYKNYIEKLDYFDTHGFISNLSFSDRYRIIKYDIGQSFHDHVDKSHFIFGSCSLALNDDYEGGDYRFFRGHHKVKLKKGQGMIWPADTFFVHGVDEITKGCKYSINSFLGDGLCVRDSTSNLPPLIDIIGMFRHEIITQAQIAGEVYHKSSEESIKILTKG